MKKIYHLLIMLILLLSLVACNNDTNEEQNDENKEEVINYPYLSTDKYSYKIGETIIVDHFTTDTDDIIGLSEYGKETSAKYLINKRLIETTEQITFPTKKLSPGDYTLFLCDGSLYETVYSLDIHIYGDDDTNYKIDSANFISSNNDIMKLSIEIKTPHIKELTYKLYWAKDNKRLDNYMAIKTVVSKDKESFVIDFNENMFMPNEANQIEVRVVEGLSESYFLNVDDTIKLPISEYLFTFNAMSDLHIQSLRDSMVFNGHLKTGLKDIYNSNSKAIFVVGDVVNMGDKENYDYFHSILNEEYVEGAQPIYYSVGNHEYMYHKTIEEALELFNTSFNYDKHYYSVEINGYKFIMLGSETVAPAGVMTQQQIDWFKSEMEKTDNNKPTFVFIHQGFKDTVAGTLNTELGQVDYGFGSNTKQLRAILKEYPNAFVFSGHSHYTLEEYKTTLYGNGLDATFINCGAMAYLNANGQEDIGGAESYYVDVYEDYIVLRGKEFVYDRWIASAQFIFKLK